MFADGHADVRSLEALGYRLDANLAFILYRNGATYPYNTYYSGTGDDLLPPDLP
jgi:hypothetical protein